MLECKSWKSSFLEMQVADGDVVKSTISAGQLAMEASMEHR